MDVAGSDDDDDDDDDDTAEEKLGVNAMKGIAPPIPRSVAVRRPAAILLLRSESDGRLFEMREV